MILIVTNKEDVHPTPVIEYLNKRGYSVFRLNTETLLTDYRFHWWVNGNGTDFVSILRNTHCMPYGLIVILSPHNNQTE